MKRVRLRVVLDAPDRPVRVGEAVTGRVEVECDEETACGGLRMELHWEASGEANEASDAAVAETIPTGAWAAGDRRTYPFSLTLPAAAPPTYDGRNFALTWEVRASADIAWAVDPSAEADLTVIPAEPGDGTLTTTEDSGCGELGCAWTCTILSIGGAAALVAFNAEEEAALFGWGGVILFFLVGLYAVPLAMAVRRLGPARIDVGPVPVARGGELAVSVTLKPRKSMALGPVTAVLTATEKAVKGAGKGKKTLAQEVAKATATLEGPDRLEAGKDAVFAGMIAVPADAPPSFVADPHEVEWSLKFTAEVPGLPDADWTVEVTVA